MQNLENLMHQSGFSVVVPQDSDVMDMKFVSVEPSMGSSKNIAIQRPALFKGDELVVNAEARFE
jgi:hypothetical protein